MSNLEYSAVIRTLGKAGDKYMRLLQSLKNQTIPPKEVIVYIAEGYELPKETLGTEKYVYVKKGMVAQRALKYDEVTTKYILFLDDDLYLPSNSVATMFDLMIENEADVVSPDIFPNSQRGKLAELMMTISGRMRARRGDEYWGYKVMRTAGYSYNSNPKRDVYWSQTNAGACFLCEKEKYLNVHFEDELWLDDVAYPIGEDQVMYYKMYKEGMRILTWYSHNIKHLDAGMNMIPEKQLRLIFSDIRFKLIFWHRFIYKPETKILPSCANILSVLYMILFSILISTLKLQFKVLRVKLSGILSACSFINSDTYKQLPLL